jgi:hypothetical protein
MSNKAVLGAVSLAALGVYARRRLVELKEQREAAAAELENQILREK